MKRWGKISFFRQNGKLVLAQNQNAKQLKPLQAKTRYLKVTGRAPVERGVGRV